MFFTLVHYSFNCLENVIKSELKKKRNGCAVPPNLNPKGIKGLPGIACSSDPGMVHMLQ